jgi:hypothetical protein
MKGEEPQRMLMRRREKIKKTASSEIREVPFK